MNGVTPLSREQPVLAAEKVNSYSSEILLFATADPVTRIIFKGHCVSGTESGSFGRSIPR
jgi:hypothetical protein